jgi:hypothetical protein
MLGGADKSMHIRNLVLAAIPLLLFDVRASLGQGKEAPFLPQDAQLIAERNVGGSTEYDLQPGLSRMAFPDSDAIYYVINEVAAMQSRLSDRLADIGRNNSDISIRFDIFRNEFVHFRLRLGVPDVRYFKVENPLLVQLSEYFEAGGYANGGGTIAYLEYQMPIAACPGLDAAIQYMQAVLRTAVNNIGSQPKLRSEGFEVFVTDATWYQLRIRMGRDLEGRFSVSENDGRSLYDPVHAIMMNIRACSSNFEPESRKHDF